MQKKIFHDQMLAYQQELQTRLFNIQAQDLVEYFAFEVGKYAFCLHMRYILRITPWQEPMHMPFLPNYALGVSTWEQRSMLLVALDKWLYQDNMHFAHYPFIIYAQYQQKSIAFAVNKCQFTNVNASHIMMDDAWFQHYLAVGVG